MLDMFWSFVAVDRVYAVEIDLTLLGYNMIIIAIESKK